MAKLDLPAGPAELLEAVRKPLGHHLGGEHRMRLGGGTALAARWRHRHSTDVDLFVDPADYEGLRTDAWSAARIPDNSNNLLGIPEKPIISLCRHIRCKRQQGAPAKLLEVSGDTPKGARILVG